MSIFGWVLCVISLAFSATSAFRTARGKPDQGVVLGCVAMAFGLIAILVVNA